MLSQKATTLSPLKPVAPDAAAGTPVGDAPSPSDDPVTGEDAPLALYVLYELHYRSFAGVDDGTLVLTVCDRGPGFAPGMLAQFGKPYQSSKGRPGGGLGLFLVVNVARTLGGTVQAVNRPEGGAAVTLTLPLSAIALDKELKHAH